MSNLDSVDGGILVAIGDLGSTVEELSGRLDVGQSAIRKRLGRLREAGLIDKDDRQEFVLTVDGQRVLAAPATGTVDDRIDTTPTVERALASLDVPLDLEAAIRSAYVFLKFWGDATKAEIQDAIYFEHPAGHASADAWWNEAVRDRLASLPEVHPPNGDFLWRYLGDVEVDLVEDGRHVAGPTAMGSVRHGVDHLPLSQEERLAVRKAFAHVFENGSVNKRDLVSDVYPSFPAGYDSSDRWWKECILKAFSMLPHLRYDPQVETWRYDRQSRLQSG